MSEALNLLKKYWGHNSFKALQKPIIESALKGIDTIALLPTGGGKSVCFQIPALMQDGICIVVSPLVALITDQVNALKDKGFKALAITGGLSFNDVNALLDNALYGDYKFLYLSPERLSQELVQNYIKQMQVSLFAVDEVHCISQWGNDFRPAYKNIHVLRNLKPNVPFMALTATATPEVLQDTILQLKLEKPQIFKQSFFRENLAYKVLEKDDKLYYIKQKLMPHKPASIVYVRSRKLTVETAQHLTKMGIPSTFYHGGMSPKQKKEVLQNWLSNKTPVIVATNAFGMGIDKPDVRYVFHTQLPESIEHYFQEAGRAGRDGAYAEAIILYNPHDIVLVKNQFIKNLATPKDLKYIYRKLNNFFQIPYGEGAFAKHSFNFSEFCKTYNLNYTLTYNALNTLDRLSIIQLNKQFGRKSIVQFLATSNRVLHFLEENPSLSIITKTILRIYGGIFETPMAINLDLIASKTGQEINLVQDVLQKLKEQQLITYQSFNTDASITFLVPREDDKTINRIANEVELLNAVKKKEVKAVINYTTNNTTCKNIQLLRYFGEEDVTKCGICNICSKQQTSPTKKEISIISQKILESLEANELSSKDLFENLIFAEPKILTVIQLLLDSKKIGINSKNQYYLN